MHTVQGLLSFVLQCLKPSNVPEEADMLLLHDFLLTKNCWKLLLPLEELCANKDYTHIAVGMLHQSQYNFKRLIG